MPSAECNGYTIAVLLDGPPVDAPEGAEDRPQINLLTPDRRWTISANDDGDWLDLRVYTRNSDEPVHQALIDVSSR